MGTVWAAVIQESRRGPTECVSTLNISRLKEIIAEERKIPRGISLLTHSNYTPHVTRKPVPLPCHTDSLIKLFLCIWAIYLYHWVIFVCQEDENNKTIPTTDLVGILSLWRKGHEKQIQRVPVRSSSVCKPFSFCPRELLQAEFHMGQLGIGIKHRALVMQMLWKEALKRAWYTSFPVSHQFLRSEPWKCSVLHPPLPSRVTFRQVRGCPVRSKP